jgi:hypothetical protein
MISSFCFSARNGKNGSMSIKQLPWCGLLAFAVACDLSVDVNDGWVEIPGTLDARDVVIPDTATAGSTFRVTIATQGDGCFRGGRTVVVQTGSRVEIEPLDLIPTPPPENCNSIERRFHHHVDLRYDQSGSVMVIVRGVRQWVQTGPLDTVTVQGTVVVRP